MSGPTSGRGDGGPGVEEGSARGAGAPTEPVVLPYGSWPSPLSRDAAAVGAVRFGGVVLSHDADGPVVRWSESRPAEGGRSALVRWSAGVVGDLGGYEISARSLVNEYGGGAFWVDGDDVYWVDSATQRIHRIADGPADRRDGTDWKWVTTSPGPPRSQRYSAGRVIPGADWMVVERERHGVIGADEPVNDIAAVPTSYGAGPEEALVGDGDFLAAPAVSPDGRCLAWLRWDHPDLPWDAAELWAARLDVVGGVPIVTDARRVAGGHEGGERLGLGRPVSVCLPEWSTDGRLWWCDDSLDWWQLRVAPHPGLPEACDGVDPVFAEPGEVGEPRWVSGGRRYGFTDDGRVVLVLTRDGMDHVLVLDPDTGEHEPLPGPALTHVEHLSVSGHHVALVAGACDLPTSVRLVDLDAGTSEDLRRTPMPLPVGAISVPEPVRAPAPGDDVVHGLLYMPRSEVATGPEGELPPLIVRIHGGPTAAARAELSTSVQFWTTRGFAVVDVNYRGSTGYGRRYRDLLRGRWGVADVEDCRSMAATLAAEGRVARGALIRGGSAGGFTALAALCADGAASERDGTPPVFAAGCSLYGVTDLAALAAETHKFESRYLDGLVGPLPGSEDVYAKRSPLTNVDSIRVPVLLLQGGLDPVVPLSQAEVLRDALAANGVPHALEVYPDEAHGFRSAATIVAALGAELAFYGAVLGVTPADRLPPVHLEPGIG